MTQTNINDSVLGRVVMITGANSGVGKSAIRVSATVARFQHGNRCSEIDWK